MIKVAGYIDRDGPSEYYRIVNPLRMLQKCFPNDFQVRLLGPGNLERGEGLDDLDILVWTRLAPQEPGFDGDSPTHTAAFIDLLHAQNTKFVLDLDDDLLAIQHSTDLLELMQAADLVTVSTSALADAISGLLPHRPPVLPNCVDSLWFIREASAAERLVPGTTVGPCGSQFHWSDWGQLREPLEWLERNYSQATILVGGWMPAYFEEFNWRHAPFVDYRDYPRLMRQFDITTCAVQIFEDPMTRAKSDVKIQESYCGGALPLCSGGATAYAGEGPWVRVPEGKWDWEEREGNPEWVDEWYDHMAYWLLREDERKEKVYQGQQWVMAEKDIRHHIPDWAAIYDLLVND